MRAPVNTQVFARIGIDLSGPFVLSATGKKYVLNIICWFSKYLISVPLEDAKAITIADALMQEFILKFGACTEIISDSAAAFTSEFYQEFCWLMNVNNKYATPYCSKGNAITERSFHTIQDVLAKMHLPYIACCYNTSIHDTTHETLFFLVFGRDPIFCADVILDPQTREGYAKTDVGMYKAQLIKRLHIAWQQATLWWAHAFLQMKRQYDKKERSHHVKVGD
ncbi:unnamed protein product [Gongylonema pulchrum]|uniref:Integrase catalytic domain-containing protein n=1 Tax=Gongylonema pulchrum TaxID=637853 RepID=A0A183EZ24_9BILA|nr:unnamed protein product [Gongylonema pulchrum]